MWLLMGLILLCLCLMCRTVIGIVLSVSRVEVGVGSVGFGVVGV